MRRRKYWLVTIHYVEDGQMYEHEIALFGDEATVRANAEILYSMKDSHEIIEMSPPTMRQD